MANTSESSGNLGKEKSFRWWEVEGDTSERIAALMQRLEIVSRRQVEAMFAGAYRSVFQGRGMDFSEVRPYQPGDEIRWIDWNVSARMDDIYVKQFVEERERTVLLVWDASPSMLLGSHWRSKQELGAEVCMILAMSALANNDRVGLLMYSGGWVVRYVKPQRGRTHLMRLVREILSYEGKDEANLSSTEDVDPALPAGPRDNVFEFLNRVAPRHSILFFLSDFLEMDESARWQRLSQRCEVIPLLLRDPVESSLRWSPREQPLDGSSSLLLHPGSWVMGVWVALLLGWGFTAGGSLLYCALAVTFLAVLALVWFRTSSGDASSIVLQDLEQPDLFQVVRVGRGHHQDETQLPVPTSPGSLRKVFQTLKLDLVVLQTDTEPVDELRAFFRRRQTGAS
ncbi:MAG: DUF58 domain-containing protein [Deltaproteobacteria bacterium]|nr:MAG: DUF58 domain-containing protein [Deltaproteobacteria bacterium]